MACIFLWHILSLHVLLLAFKLILAWENSSQVCLCFLLSSHSLIGTDMI